LISVTMAGKMKHLVLASVFLFETFLHALTQCTAPTSGFHLDGDFLIGGLFDVHYPRGHDRHLRPEALDCSSIFLLPSQIKNSTSLLPNVALGYEMFDHCSDTLSFPGILKLISVNGQVQPWVELTTKVIAVVGPFTSTQALTVAPFFMTDLIPMVNYGSSTSIFSKKAKFPSFLRTVHPNSDVIEVILTILKHFDWRWVAFLYTADDYGYDGLDLFINRVRGTEICIAYSKDIKPGINFSRLFQQIERQNIHVIIVFAAEVVAEALIESAIRFNVTNKVWIANDAWSLNKRLPKMKEIRNIGTVLGVAQPVVKVPGFGDFIRSAESHAKCDYEGHQMLCNQVCNCSDWSAKDILEADPSFSFSVYSAVYAIAHALHKTLQCGEGGCKNITVYPKMVSIYLNLLVCPFLVDPYSCISCKETEWSKEGSTSCNLRLVEYIPFTDVGAVLIMAGACILVGLSGAISVLFATNYNTPVVRSAGGPMCFLILGCLIVCSVSVFFYFGKPTNASCILRYFPFLLFFTVCLACFVVRSFQIICIFKIAAKFPKLQTWWTKYHGQWLLITAAFTAQALLLITSLTYDPPIPYNETLWHQDQIVLFCSLNLEVTSCTFVLLVFLSCLCFIFSYMGKDLPKNYNEAKAITFCLLLLVVTWILFVTIYLLYQGKFIQILNALAVLCSLYSFLLWYFLPKCYIIIFQSHKNTPQPQMSVSQKKLFH
uniref:Taste receptor type 1 member 1-like n=1 Tax=Fundulus heteroclitus TaxID=8078 RepID=A0A3Q2NQX4_FUNHE